MLQTALYTSHHKHLQRPYMCNPQNIGAVRYAPGVDLACLRRLLKATELSCKAGTWPACMQTQNLSMPFCCQGCSLHPPCHGQF